VGCKPTWYYMGWWSSQVWYYCPPTNEFFKRQGGMKPTIYFLKKIFGGDGIW